MLKFTAVVVQKLGEKLELSRVYVIVFWSEITRHFVSFNNVSTVEFAVRYPRYVTLLLKCHLTKNKSP